MSRQSAFDYPPGAGNAIALVVCFAVFLAVQLGLSLRYTRKWNWPILSGLIISLTLGMLGGIAFLELHYAPVAGAWYSVWIFTLTAGPIFFISSLHFCVYRVLGKTRSVVPLHKFLQPSPRDYIMLCVGIDSLALTLTIIGAAYAGAKSSSSSSPGTSKPGFNVMVAGMAIQLCSLMVAMIVLFATIVAIKRDRHQNVSSATPADPVDESHANSYTPKTQRTIRSRFFLVFLANLQFMCILLFAWAIIRAVNLAGGLEGPLRNSALVGAESILLFIGILFITITHPAVVLRKLQQDNSNK